MGRSSEEAIQLVSVKRPPRNLADSLRLFEKVATTTLARHSRQLEFPKFSD
jgi:hypothetical protein